jgi:ketosteroid isomerase-like protein
MITDSDIALVLRAYEAYARGDIDAAIAGLHPDVDWIEPPEFPGGGARHGPPAVADYLRPSRARWAELVSESTAHRHGDDIVVVHHVHGVTVDGTPAEATVADVYTLREGTVVRMQAYADPAEVLAG